MNTTTIQSEVDKAVKILRQGGLILYPTDTVWGIGCDATNAEAVDKVYALKQSANKKSMIVLVGDIDSVGLYVNHAPQVAWELFETAVSPLTLILPGAARVADNLVPEEGTLGVRVPNHEFCRQMLKRFGRPMTAEALAEDETQSVRVRIDKDSETLWADFSILEKGEDYYGCLDFDNSMIRYADERFLNIELILEDETGLKIPKSSVVEENFYVIPEDYITTGGNSSSDGVMVRDSDGSGVFQEISVFDITEDGEAYVSREDLSEGDVLIRPESSETYTVEEVRTLTGVYNINRGYAVFKKVTILCENDEYYIVQEGEDYGLYNYDHIVQDGSGVRPDEVVFQ